MTHHQEEELYELCKAVYEATKLGEYEELPLYCFTCGEPVAVNTKLPDDKKEHYSVPLYTSDYILEKLPGEVLLAKHLGEYYANQSTNDYSVVDTTNRGDTPLKTLLKLTLALNEQGLLERGKE